MTMRGNRVHSFSLLWERVGYRVLSKILSIEKRQLSLYILLMIRLLVVISQINGSIIIRSNNFSYYDTTNDLMELWDYLLILKVEMKSFAMSLFIEL